MQHKFQTTIYACFTGYIVQAIVNNFAPLLFLTFEKIPDPAWSDHNAHHDQLRDPALYRSAVCGICGSDRVSGIDFDRACVCGTRAFGACGAAGAVSERVCRTSDRSCDLCDRWRTDRGADQPDHGKLSDR